MNEGSEAVKVRALDAERCVIGSLLLAPDSVLNDADVLALVPDDFTSEQFAKAFSAALEMKENSEKIDYLLIAERAGIPAEQIVKLYELTPTAVNAGEYAKLVKEYSSKRKLSALFVGIQSSLNNVAVPEVLASIRSELDAIEAGAGGGGSLGNKEALVHLYKRNKAISNGAASSVKTDYKELNRILGGGLLGGRVYVIAARPGMGKTALALNLLDAMEQSSAGLFASLEMSVDELTARRVALHSGIPAEAIMQRAMTEEEQQKFNTCAAKLSKKDRRAVINDKIKTLADISKEAARVSGLGWLIIDYFTLLQEPTAKAQSRYELYTNISRDIKKLARRLDVPVILLSQLNREVAGRSDHRPALSDIRETGALEQDADVVMLLHREDYYRQEAPANSSTPSLLEVIIAKNRHGPSGTLRFAFYGRNGLIKELQRK